MAWAMDELEARAHRQLEALYSVQDDIGAVRVVEESADGRVRVDVDGAGGLVGLTLSPTAAQLGAAELARVIVDTAARGAHRALAQRACITTEFLTRFAELTAPPGDATTRTSRETPSATTQSDSRS
ncbi:YbaB/EbfC family nucleoid-associated protein [Gordonia asplenii]|uniref:YbaB/EbfC family nucleoid-associated protein n=1 Tax=Gordonia asplenii TaxID=2725283 RepID=UPI001B7D4A9A|nr:YbaB/EbfC family nucleoid-associated protein [Gordonia asplenii]